MSPFDPVTLEILWNRLIAIADECWVTIYRTAFSTIIGEALDFGVELLDGQGNSLAHAPRSMPVFNYALPTFCRRLLESFPPESLSPGDVLIGNDPWLLAGHLFDIGIVTPVFRGDRLVALVGSVGHASDIGGTYDHAGARELYDEGLFIPPLKLYRAGEPNEDVFAFIRHNVRKPEWVLGDIHAQISANAVGARRLLALMDEYGLEDLTDLAREVQDRAEGAMRGAIAALPDGTYRSEVWLDGTGEPLCLPCRVIVQGDGLTVDYEGAPPQQERGALNCTLNYTVAHTVYALKCVLTPEVPSNAGCYRPIAVRAPEGSILNCRKPAAVNLRVRTGWRLAPAIFRALAEALPHRVQAFTGLPLAIGVYGIDEQGRSFHDHLFQGGGQGASAHGDGKSGLLFPTSAANVSVEMFEQRTPLVVECKELIPDSGGAGRFRGGLGQRVRVARHPGARARIWVDVTPEGMIVETPGLFGGRPGRRTRVAYCREGRWEELPLGGLVELGPGERVEIEIAGGSGYGDPRARDPELVRRDLEEGYVTREGARRDYGLTPAGTARSAG